MNRALVAVLYNEPLARVAGEGAPHQESDAGVLVEVAAVADALRHLGIPFREAPVCNLQDVGVELAAGEEPFVINLVESLDGSAQEACLVPAVCSAHGRRWTGSGTACQLLSLDKWQTKCALRAAGIPVPDGCLLGQGEYEIPPLARDGPVIVKPARSDAGEGIEAASVIPESDVEALRKRIDFIHDEFGQPALVERYVDGREFNISLLERNGDVLVLPPAEIEFRGFGGNRPRIVDYRAKWVAGSFEFENTPRRVPADVDDAIAARLMRAAEAAWNTMGCRDYARVDMRLDGLGRVFVIEVNPNPDISPDSGFAAALGAYGITYPEFVKTILKNAGLDVRRSSRRGENDEGDHGLRVRRSEWPDRKRILQMLVESGIFRDCELDVAREVLDDGLIKGEAGDYQSYTAVERGKPVGWACFGPTPCTSRAFDLYWLVVDPICRRRGAGAALIERVEDEIAVRGGRIVVVETSSRNDYDPARRFYAEHGYVQVGSVADFYDVGDDKLVYKKEVSAAKPHNAR